MYSSRRGNWRAVGAVTCERLRPYVLGWKAYFRLAHTSTLPGDAQPFGYQPDMPDVDAVQVAGSEGTPRNNQAQNKQLNAVVKALGLNENQASQLHDDISKQGLGYQEMLERGQDMFGGGQD